MLEPHTSSDRYANADFLISGHFGDRGWAPVSFGAHLLIGQLHLDRHAINRDPGFLYVMCERSLTQQPHSSESWLD
jgi:hypothetical protein